jgi:hypothetical protein
VGGAWAPSPLRTVLESVDPLVEPLVCARCSSRTRCVVFYQDQSLSLSRRGPAEDGANWVEGGVSRDCGSRRSKTGCPDLKTNHRTWNKASSGQRSRVSLLRRRCPAGGPPRGWGLGGGGGGGGGVSARDDYFEQLGLGWASQRLDVPMTSFTPDSIRAAFGGCVAAAAPATLPPLTAPPPPSLLCPPHPPLTPLPAPPTPPSSTRRVSKPAAPPFACRRLRAWRGSCEHHQVLAFRSRFAAWDPRPGGPNPAGWQVGGMPGLAWLDGLAAPALLAPSAGVARLVDALLRELTRPPTATDPAPASTVVTAPAPASASASPPPPPPPPPPPRQRRGSTSSCACTCGEATSRLRDCPRYAAEAAGRQPRPWVRAHFDNGWSCLNSERGGARAQPAPPLKHRASRGADAPRHGRAARLLRRGRGPLARRPPRAAPLRPVAARGLFSSRPCARTRCRFPTRSPRRS